MDLLMSALALLAVCDQATDVHDRELISRRPGPEVLMVYRVFPQRRYWCYCWSEYLQRHTTLDVRGLEEDRDGAHQYAYGGTLSWANRNNNPPPPDP